MYEDCIINSELELINIIIDWSRPKFLPTEWFNWHGQEIIWWIKSTKSLTKNVVQYVVLVLIFTLFLTIYFIIYRKCCSLVKTNWYCDVKHFISFKILSSDIGKTHISILLYTLVDNTVKGFCRYELKREMYIWETLSLYLCLAWYFNLFNELFNQ